MPTTIGIVNKGLVFTYLKGEVLTISSIRDRTQLPYIDKNNIPF